MIKNKKLIVANWKMNPTTLAEAKKLFENIKKTASKVKNIQTVICPPSVYLSELGKLYSGRRIALGAQDVFWEKKGAYTGEQSSKMIKDIGAKYVIIGHSERRERGETNEMVNKKIITSLEEGLNVILCIGEKVRDLQALYLKFLEEEIRSACKSLTFSPIHKITFNPSSKEVIIFLFTILFVSPLSLLSECPMITYFAPMSFIILDDCSPV